MKVEGDFLDKLSVGLKVEISFKWKTLAWNNLAYSYMYTEPQYPLS